MVDWGNAADSNPVKFWATIDNYCDASGKGSFTTLFTYALRVMTLPISNADIEWSVFSQVSFIKTEHRNRMGQPLMNAIIYTKAANKCFAGDEDDNVKKGCHCPGYQPTNAMVQCVLTADFYDNVQA